MIKKYFFIFIIILFLIIAVMNSYDVRGVEELSYVIAIGLDKSIENENNIILSIQIGTTKSSESGGTSDLKTSIYSVEANSVTTALSLLDTLSTNEINLSHCSAIIISEELAKEGINPHFDNIANNIEIRPTSNIIISSSTALNFLNAASKSEDISAKFYTSFTGLFESTGFISRCTLASFYAALHSDNQEPVAIYGFTDGNTLENLGVSVFKGDTFVGRLSSTETVFHNLFINKLETASISFTSPIDNKSIIDITISPIKNTDIDVSLENGNSNIECKLYIEANIVSSANNYNFANEDDMKRLEKAIKDEIVLEATNYLNKISREYNSDIVGFFGYLKKHYLYMDDMQNIDFKNSFKNSKFNVDAIVELESNFLFSKT